jgi:hypothetical protein
MNPSVQAFRRLWINVALSHNAPERGLNMLAGASKTIVQIEMAKRGVEIVAPKQSDHTAAEPDTFRVAGRTADLRRRFGEFIDPALRVFRGIGGLACLWRLIARLAVRLGERIERSKDRRAKCNGEDKRGERHERAGSYEAVIATTDVLISLYTDVLISLYNDWVSIATCRSNPRMPNLRCPCLASAANVLKVPRLGSVAGNG